MVAKLKSGEQEKHERLRSALKTFQDTKDIEKLKRKIAAAKGKTSWLVAGVVDGLDRSHAPPPIPSEFTVIATDGSQIDVDRHRSARCYLINIGAIMLHYGQKPDALLGSFPQLYADAKDLVIAPPDGRGREQMIEGNLLGIKRDVDECAWLAKMATELPANVPVLALLDGTLIKWMLGNDPSTEFVTKALLDDGFLKCLETMRQLTETRKFALASYISYPRSTDVVNTLRIALCPFDQVDCDRNCADNKEKVCDAVAGVRDADIFSRILKNGERSAIFVNQSSVMKRYGAHLIYFFYMKLDNEIARIEVPEWVALNGELLSLAHSLVLDQCRRGQGYPVVLSEAHEQAVVTNADREQFWELVESLMADEKMPSSYSAKSFSKRTRWI